MNQDQSNQDRSKLSPIFIVGAPRSGTTLLAVLFDRHSRIAIPPETQFFSEFLNKYSIEIERDSHQKIVDKALNFKRISDLNLNRDDLLDEYFEKEKTLPNLLASILICYARQKKKKRSGEKTPRHVEYIPEIINYFPEAKIICILRDGRDVVRSLLNVSWAEPQNPRRFSIFCMEWSDMYDKLVAYTNRYPSDQITLIKYEDLLVNPEQEMRRLCRFVDEDYEPGQLNPESNSNVVPEWEDQWKGKSLGDFDTSRIQAWKKDADQIQIWRMNNMMGKTLKKAGYTDYQVIGCPLSFRLRLFFEKMPYLKPMRPFSLAGLKLARYLRITK